MKKTTWLVLFYALFILLGGIMGYVQAGSKASLISGLCFGTFLLGASFLLLQKKKAGYWLALSLVLLLEAFFIWRFSKSLHFFPSGFLSLLSLFVIIVLTLKLRVQRRTH